MTQMDIRRQHSKSPYFSVCIPQHNRTSFLLEALRVLAKQSFRDFEICIADDCSTDGREQELIDFLTDAGLSFAFKTNERNLQYDGNLRASIALATGRYCLLHGNDDCLRDADSLLRLWELLEQHGRPGVAVTNFEQWSDGAVNRRVPATVLHPSGPETAAARFRNVAFVTGVILDRELSQDYATDRWDGSEMYQMYLLARILSSGRTLLEISESLVRKDIAIPGEMVDSHLRRPKLDPCPIEPRVLPMSLIGRVVSDGIGAEISQQRHKQLNAVILRQLYTFTYPRWLVEYRRTQSWKFALGLCLGQSPKYVAGDVDLSTFGSLEIHARYLLAALAGLCVPLKAYDKAGSLLYAIAKGR